MIHLAEQEIEQHEAWINELQELHEEARLLTRSTSPIKLCRGAQKRVDEFHKQLRVNDRDLNRKT